MYFKLLLNKKKLRGKVTDPLRLAGYLLSLSFACHLGEKERPLQTSDSVPYPVPRKWEKETERNKVYISQVKSCSFRVPHKLIFGCFSHILVCSYIYLKNIVLAKFWLRKN